MHDLFSSTLVSSKPASPSNRKIRVYVVDDHALIRAAVVDLLTREADMDICGEAPNAAIAFNEIAKKKPDVVLVDLSLSGNSGLELLKSIRSLDDEIGVIVLTMHAESIYGLRSLRAGARGYVMKNEAPATIVNAIRQVYVGRVFASASLTAQIIGSVHRGAASSSADPITDLSDRELEIVELIGKGYTTNEIASQLHVSVKTIETHRGHIKEKLQLENCVQLIHYCVRWVQEGEMRAAVSH